MMMIQFGILLLYTSLIISEDNQWTTIIELLGLRNERKATTRLLALHYDNTPRQDAG